jgi:type IV fimbrial biogenesis protein FimT
MNQTLSNNSSPHSGRRTRLASRRVSGFTLIELMTTLSIVAILAAVAVPSFQYVTNANRMASEVNGLLGDMQFARGEAIKEGQTVVICSSTDAATCAGSASWKTGWIVFSDLNGNGAWDAGEPVWRVQKAFKGTDTFNADNATKFVRFNREGFAVGANIVTITMHDSTSDPKWTRCLKISTVGMLTTTRYSTATSPAWPGPCT